MSDLIHKVAGAKSGPADGSRRLSKVARMLTKKSELVDREPPRRKGVAPYEFVKFAARLSCKHGDALGQPLELFVDFIRVRLELRVERGKGSAPQSNKNGAKKSLLKSEQLVIDDAVGEALVKIGRAKCHAVKGVVGLGVEDSRHVARDLGEFRKFLGHVTRGGRGTVVLPRDVVEKVPRNARLACCRNLAHGSAIEQRAFVDALLGFKPFQDRIDHRPAAELPDTPLDAGANSVEGPGVDTNAMMVNPRFSSRPHASPTARGRDARSSV
jgi:hypothetical protein